MGIETVPTVLRARNEVSGSDNIDVAIVKVKESVCPPECMVCRT